ncbi:hypothetical protein CLOM_g2990, partial [Closterium sp. NIES-68]
LTSASHGIRVRSSRWSTRHPEQRVFDQPHNPWRLLSTGPTPPTPRGEGQPGAPGGRGGGGGGTAGRIAHSPSYPNSGYATNGDGNLGGSRRSLEGGGGSSKALSRSSSGAVANADATGGNGEVGSSRWLRRGESGEGSGKHWSGTSSAFSASSETPRAWASQLSASGDNSGGAIVELGDYNDQMATSPYPEAIKEEEGSVEGRNVPMPDVTLEEELAESLMPLKWVFFPEADPIQQFRGKPWREKIWVFLKGVFPILEWLPKYDLWYYLLGDIIGGVSIAIMSVPQAAVSSRLCCTAIQGSSKHFMIAPVSVVSQLLGITLSAIVDPNADPALPSSRRTSPCGCRGSRLWRPRESQ